MNKRFLAGTLGLAGLVGVMFYDGLWRREPAYSELAKDLATNTELLSRVQLPDGYYHRGGEYKTSWIPFGKWYSSHYQTRVFDQEGKVRFVLEGYLGKSSNETDDLLCHEGNERTGTKGRKYGYGATFYMIEGNGGLLIDDVHNGRQADEKDWEAIHDLLKKFRQYYQTRERGAFYGYGVYYTGISGEKGSTVCPKLD